MEQRFPFLDLELALSYCAGDVSLLEELLQIFCEDTDPNRFTELLDSGDIANYVIEVHALKNNARSIGAPAVSELAKTLEMAGRSGDAAFIAEHHPQLAAECTRLLEQIKAALADN